MDQQANRPYFKYSIFELEALFYRSKSDSGILHAIVHELSFRSKARSTTLDAKVKDVLAAMPACEPPLPQAKTVRAGLSIEPPDLTQPKVDSIIAQQKAGDPETILAAWTAIEALSPQTYQRPEDLSSGDRSCIAGISTNRVPWESRERSRPNKQLYYQVILGAIRMDLAVEELVKCFGDDEERSSRTGGNAAIAAILLDRNGVPVRDNGIAISSFAWALPLALKLNLGALGAWPIIEPQLVESLERVLLRHDEDGNPIPLDAPTINAARDWLVTQLEIPSHLTEQPPFAVRIYVHFKSKPPAVSLLNSFFLGDLRKAAHLLKNGQAPAGLRRYLGIDTHKQTFDLLTDRVALEQAVAPALTPAARWPSPGGDPLVLLQQAAVNLAHSELVSSGGVIAVNGSPGTGKTTLLRDIVVGSILDRALAMAEFEDPAKAFTPSGEKMAAGDHAFCHLYALAQSLKGHEIVVASSNNKAVENISKELPAITAIGRAVKDLSYFRSVSDLVHAEPDSVDKPVETWGLVAAALGNAANRTAFQQSFWWHEDYSFRLYLKAAKGDPVVREIKDSDTGTIKWLTPLVISAEHPPSPETAKANWKNARRRLLSLHAEIVAELKALEEVRKLCLKRAEALRLCAQEEAALARLAAERPQADEHKSRCHAEVLKIGKELSRRKSEIRRHLQTRPGLFARVLRSERWRIWSQAHSPLKDAASVTARSLQSAERVLSEASAEIAALLSETGTVKSRLVAAKGHLDELSNKLNAQRPLLGDRLVDDQFFSRSPKIWNLAAPWISERLHHKRENLFIAAMQLHKAFIDASAQKILHNLTNLMTVLSGRPPRDEAKLKLLGDLWSTLFLVVPVVSTAFASIENMFGGLPSGSIGWLLIDEAGQALPQAAVGAIMRAKRSIVVGDPLQIPPVVTLPERLVSEICKFFQIEKSPWAAPEASAQTVADRASKFQAEFQSDLGSRRVGIPLLVHRRCQEPMFGICNRIAYGGRMVHAAGKRTARVEKALGVSMWFDIDGEADSKWCPAEGEQVVELLKMLAAASIPNPDLFLITPFRIVAWELKRRLKREEQLLSELGVEATNWLKDRVGTIHTVQGRQAEAVILVLGAPKASQHGARNWAAGTPNILNVAVSRAKENLYIVGSHGAWSGVGYARELASLPHTRILPIGDVSNHKQGAAG